MKKYLKLIDGKWCINVPKIVMILDEANILEDQEMMVIFGFGPMLLIEDKSDKILEKRALVAATQFTTKPVEVEKEDNVYKLYYDMEHQTSHPFCVNENLIKDITNVETMFKLLSGGKITNKIDKELYLDIILNNMRLNETLDVSERDIEIMLSNYIRDAKDPTKPVRLTGNDEYMVMSYKNLVAQQSTFAAITHEDPRTMLSISLTKKEKDETPSPLEKYMRM